MPVGPQRKTTTLNFKARGIPGRLTSRGFTKLMGVTVSERGEPSPMMGRTVISPGGMPPDAPMVGASKRKRAQEREQPSKTTFVSKSGGPGVTVDRELEGRMGEVIGGAGKPAGGSGWRGGKK